jgi:hypothetical protein
MKTNVNNTSEPQHDAKLLVSGSFYGKIGATKITIRRASDDALLTVDLSTDKGKQEAELFCKGTDGYLYNYR